jgi:hypothetical protein
LGADVDNDPTDPLNILMVSVIAQFMANIDKDEETAGHTDSESGDVDKGISFMPLEISQGDFKIIFYHCGSPKEKYFLPSTGVSFKLFPFVRKGQLYILTYKNPNGLQKHFFL